MKTSNGGNWVMELQGVVDRLLPRLLTQACRDPHSPAYGCFDRDWWHYRIRDFPSIILQQGAYTAWLAGRQYPSPWPSPARGEGIDRGTPSLARGEGMDRGAPSLARGEGMDERGISSGEESIDWLAAAACRFWNARACRTGAFEEYYPFEQGYPPLAFSTLAVAKLAHAGAVAPSEIREGLKIAARQLLNRFEPEAANQQVAGLAALAWLQRLDPKLVPGGKFADISGKTLSLQTSEGWFMEYGGPDLGYLSVTLDCLWDCFDATGDARYRDAAAAGLRCIGRYVETLGGGIGMHNARNTDYILPYGIARFLCTGSAAKPSQEQQTPEAAQAARVLCRLYGSAGQASHFLRAMDDRYLSHYAGHSLVRALPILKGANLGGEVGITGFKAEPGDLLMEQSGHVLQAVAGRRYALIVSLKKGGILTAVGGQGSVSDFGWVVREGGRQHVNHWWSEDWRWKRDGDRLVVSGRMSPHREYVSTPLKHTMLRMMSRVFGRRLIAPLKNLLIFKKGAKGYAFERVVTPGRDGLVVEDRIAGLPAGVQVVPAPRSSKRHVASADSFHAEDLALVHGGRRDGTTKLAGGVFEARTVYTVL